MSEIVQAAGGSRIGVYTDGWPHWPKVSLTQANGEVVSATITVADLHDLRYCIERVLAQLPPK